MQTPAPFGYERATSVDHAIQLLEQLGPGRPADRRRAQLHPDDEAPPGAARARDRHQRSDAELGSIAIESNHLVIGAMARHNDLLDSAVARRALPGPARRRACDRRPGRAQPRHDRRFAVPGRSGRGPVGGAVGAPRRGRDPRRRAARAPCRCASSTPGRTRRSSATPRSSPTSGSRSATAAAAPTRRSSGASATGRSPPPPPWCGWTATRSPTPASACAAVGAEHFVVARGGGPPDRQQASDDVIEAAARPRPRRATRRPTSAGRPSTSAISPAS